MDLTVLYGFGKGSRGCEFLGDAVLNDACAEASPLGFVLCDCGLCEMFERRGAGD